MQARTLLRSGRDRVAFDQAVDAGNEEERQQRGYEHSADQLEWRSHGRHGVLALLRNGDTFSDKARQAAPVERLVIVVGIHVFSVNSRFPNGWITVAMEDRHHIGLVFLEHVADNVRKTFDECLPDLPVNNRVEFWRLADTFENSFNTLDEFAT